MIKNILANIAGKGVNVILALICIPLYLSFLGIEAYGIIGFFYSLIAIITMFSFGLTSVTTRQLARNSVLDEKIDSIELVGTFEWIYSAISLLVIFCFWVFESYLRSSWINSSLSLNHIIFLMGLSLALHLPYCLYESALMGLQRQVRVNILNSAFAIARSVGAVFILWLFSSTLVAFFTWQVIVSLIQILTFRIYTYTEWGMIFPVPKWNFEILKQNRSLVIESGGTVFLSHCFFLTDKLILSKMLSLESFGYYCLAGSVCNVIHYFVFPVTQSFYPTFSQRFALKEKIDSVHTEETSKIGFWPALVPSSFRPTASPILPSDMGCFGDRKSEGTRIGQKSIFEVSSVYYFGMKIIFIIILPLGAILYFFSQDILLIWTKNPLISENTYKIVSLLAIAKVFEGLIQLPWTLAFAYGSRKVVLYQQFIALLLLVPLMVWATFHLGVYGACYVLIGLNLSFLLFGIPLIHKKIILRAV